MYLTSITEQYAVIAVQGPKAGLLVPELNDLSHMGAAGAGPFEGIPCRLFRASFTGEVGCEINVPWGEGAALWEKLCERGAAFGFTVYGTETMHVLRAERGFIIVGQETDGTVTPHDLGLESMIGAGEARLRRQAFSCAPGSARGEPQAARRPADRRSGPRARGRRPARRRPARAHTDDRARPRHVELRQRELRALDRHGAGRRRPGTPRRNRLRDDCRRLRCGKGPKLPFLHG